MRTLYVEDIQGLEELEIARFPLVEDLVVRLVDAGPFGRHVELASERSGKLAGFPYWDYADKRITHPDFEIPLGTCATPFDDLEQGWQIVIWEAKGYAMVMEGDEIGSLYDRLFRVDVAAYRRAWNLAIEDVRRRLAARR